MREVTSVPFHRRKCWLLWLRIGLLVGIGTMRTLAADVSITFHNQSPFWKLTGQWYYTHDPAKDPLSWSTTGYSVQDLAPGASATYTFPTGCSTVWADVQAYTNAVASGTRFYSTVAGPIFCGGSGDVYVYVPTGRRPNDANDGSDCSDSCPACGGMPVWSVSEPYISLWLHDEPLGYQPALGPRVSFQLAFKQREISAGSDTNTFSLGRKWNFSWFSYVTRDSHSNNVVHFPGGREATFVGTSDFLTNTRLTGDGTNGFTLSHPDGSTDIYGFMVPDASGNFLKALVSERWNPQSQKTTFLYSGYPSGTSAVIRLQYVIDADGRTNTVYYATNNSYSANLISQVLDPYGRAASFVYDNYGRLVGITDVAGLSASLTYDTNDWVTSLNTPYGNTSFSFDDGTPSYRSVVVTQPDGGKHLFRYEDGVPGLASSFATNEVPDTSPFSNTFDNAELNLRNSFYWSPRQIAALSTTNLFALTTSDYLKARMKHWLKSATNWVGESLSLERDPSPDGAGTIEGQKTWYDYTGKTNTANEGTQALPLLVAMVLPDGTSRFTRWSRNGLGTVTNEISTYSVIAGGPVLRRTNTLVFDANGIDLLRTINTSGIQVSSNSFNAFHQVLTNFNALNEMTVFTYDNAQRLASVIGPSGLFTTNFYGSDGLLAQQIVSGISTNSYTYTNGLVYTHTDDRNQTTTNVYDALQRLVQISDSRGTIAYDYRNLDLVRVVDRMGFTNSYGYDGVRRKIADTNAVGAYTLYNYCTCGVLDSVRDATAHDTRLYYDNQGRLTNVAYADNYGVTNRYNLLGQLVRTTDSSGASTTNWFNNQGLVIAVSNSFGRVQVAVYDPLDRLTNAVDENSVSITTAYDDLDRVRSRTYPDGGVESFGYTLNISGATSYTNQLGQVTCFAYDTANRRIAETNANGEVTLFSYSGPGDLLALTDGKNQTTRWRYDSFGRVTNKLDHPGTNLFFYTYDPNNRLSTRTSAAKGTTVYGYDPIGNLTNIVYPVSPAIALSYDALNRLTNMLDAVGTTRYSYDSIGQILSEDGPWPSDTMSYTYTNRLRKGLTLLVPYAATWTQSYAYDGIKRLANVASPAGAFGYSYTAGLIVSPSSLVRKLALPNGAYITNTYDSHARLLSTRLKSGNGTVLNSHSYAYNTGNQRTQQAFTAGNYADYTYDPIGRLKTARGKESGGVTNRLHEQFGYGYDAAGNLNSRTNNSLVQAFTVNPLNELTTVARNGTLTVAGTTTSQATNVTVNTSNAVRYLDRTFASINHSLANGNNTFTATARDSAGRQDTSSLTVNLPVTNSFAYDLNGNLVTNGTEVLVYDDENQLVRISAAGAWKSEFTYDGRMRRRIQRDFRWTGSLWVQTNEIRFIYDGNLIVQHRNAYNQTLLTLTRGMDLSGGLQSAGGIGGLLAMTDNAGAHSCYHADGNGNVTMLINSNQLVVARYEYDPFGNTLSISGPKAWVNPCRFSSKPIHELSGRYDFLLRWYAPELQRWLSRDPIGESEGVSLYGFVGNDAVDFWDAVGLQKGAERLMNLRPPPGRDVISGVVVRRLVGAGGHQWLGFHTTSGLVHVGVNKGENKGMWVDETQNRPRDYLENRHNYYEWEVAKRNLGWMPDKTPCRCATHEQIQKCIGESILYEASAGTPHKFNIMFNNCRANSERILRNCCAQKGSLVNNPDDTNFIGRFFRDWFKGPTVYIPMASGGR